MTAERLARDPLPARLTAQLLAGAPASDPLAVTRHLLAVQGQDPRGARLAIRSRSSGLTAADVDRALTEERSLLITWLNRGTLHLICSEDYAWLHALTTPPLLTANARRLAQEGVSPSDAERGVAIIERALAAEGPLTRARLRERLDRAGIPTKGQALVHLLLLASLRGLVVRGPMADREHAYVLVHDWLGKQAPVDREAALAELARRYLIGHGPAEDRDLARWAGLPLRDARAGLSTIASELGARGDGTPAEGTYVAAARGTGRRSAGLVDLAKRAPAAPLPPPRLLGAFDPLLLGWCSREPLLGSHKGIVTINGIFRPFALVRGRAVATWSMPAGEVVLAPFGRLTRADRTALEAEAEDVVRYLKPASPGPSE